MRERQARCVNASPGQYARGQHMTMNDDLICDRCKSSLEPRPTEARDALPSATRGVRHSPGDPSSAVASVVGRGGTGALAVSPTGALLRPSPSCALSVASPQPLSRPRSIACN